MQASPNDSDEGDAVDGGSLKDKKAKRKAMQASPNDSDGGDAVDGGSLKDKIATFFNKRSKKKSAPTEKAPSCTCDPAASPAVTSFVILNKTASPSTPPHIVDLDDVSSVLRVTYTETRPDLMLNEPFYRTITIGEVALLKSDDDVRPPFAKNETSRLVTFDVDAAVLAGVHAKAGMCAPVRIDVRLHSFKPTASCYSKRSLAKCAADTPASAAAVAVRYPCPLLRVDVVGVAGADLCKDPDSDALYAPQVFCNAPHDTLRITLNVSNAGGATMPAGSALKLSQLDHARLADATCAYRGFVKSLVHGSSSPIAGAMGNLQGKAILSSLGISKSLLDDRMVDRLAESDPDAQAELIKALVRTQRGFSEIAVAESYGDSPRSARGYSELLSPEVRKFAKHLRATETLDLLGSPVWAFRGVDELPPGAWQVVEAEVPLLKVKLLNEACAQDGLPPVVFLAQADADDPWSGVTGSEEWRSSKGALVDNHRIVGVRFSCASLRLAGCKVDNLSAINADDDAPIPAFDVTDEMLGPGSSVDLICLARNNGTAPCPGVTLRARTALGGPVACEARVDALDAGGEQVVKLRCDRDKVLPPCMGIGMEYDAAGALWLALDDDGVCLSDKLKEKELADLDDALAGWEDTVVAKNKERQGMLGLGRLFGRRLHGEQLPADSSLEGSGFLKALTAAAINGGAHASATRPAHVGMLALERACNKQARFRIVDQLLEVNGRKHVEAVRRGEEDAVLGIQLWQHVDVAHSAAAASDTPQLTLKIPISNDGDEITLSPFEVTATISDLGLSGSGEVMQILAPGDQASVNITLDVPSTSRWWLCGGGAHSLRIVVDAANLANARGPKTPPTVLEMLVKPSCPSLDTERLRVADGSDSGLGVRVAPTCDAAELEIDLTNSGAAPIPAGDLWALWTITPSDGSEITHTLVPVPITLAVSDAYTAKYAAAPSGSGCGRIKASARLYRALPQTQRTFKQVPVSGPAALDGVFVAVGDPSDALVRWDAACCKQAAP